MGSDVLSRGQRTGIWNKLVELGNVVPVVSTPHQGLR